MVPDTFFSFACAGVIVMLFGLALSFAGYRLFLYLLPIWGFFFGLMFGAQTMQALLGSTFLGTVTSWVVGFLVGGTFAVLSYAFYFIAVAIIAGSLGYIVATNLLLWIGLPFGILTWLIGLAAGVVVAVVAIRFNWQKVVVIAATSIVGAGIISGMITVMFNPALRVLENPIGTAIRTSPFLIVLFLLIAVLGFVVQYNSTRMVEADTYYQTRAAAPPQ